MEQINVSDAWMAEVDWMRGVGLREPGTTDPTPGRWLTWAALCEAVLARLADTDDPKPQP